MSGEYLPSYDANPFGARPIPPDELATLWREGIALEPGLVMTPPGETRPFGWGRLGVHQGAAQAAISGAPAQAAQAAASDDRASWRLLTYAVAVILLAWAGSQLIGGQNGG